MKTTIEISDALLEKAKRVAAREKTTLHALVETGLRAVLRERQNYTRFHLRDASFRGNGLSPEFANANWERIRAAASDGRDA